MASSSAAAKERPQGTIELPRPSRSGGTSVLAALWKRRTEREIGSRPIELKLLSNLLFAAAGVNRPAGRGPFDGVGRTAGSASNAQELEVHVALGDGIYRYDAGPHRLVAVASGDHRALAISPGQRGMLGDAPVHLLYVVDLARYESAPFQEPGLWDEEVQRSYASVAVGLTAGNVELFAASVGLGSWFHNCDREGLAKVLGLSTGRRALYGHTLGWPLRAMGTPRAPRRRPMRRSRASSGPVRARSGRGRGR